MRKHNSTLTLLSAGIISAISGTAFAQSQGLVLDTVHVTASAIHPSQQLRSRTEQQFTASRASTQVDGSVLKSLNAVNISDTLRYNSVGMLTTPYNGNRFGGGSKIRTFGDWGAATSIDGLPAFRSAGQEGGGYTGTLIPSIAVQSVSVLRGSQAVSYGDGTDGGTLVTKIKSGRGYNNHQAISLDTGTADEVQLQAEAAHGTEQGDFYVAGRWLEGYYSGEPSNMDSQSVKGGLAKFGLNYSPNTRFEALLIHDNSKPDIFRRGALNKISSKESVASLTVDHSLSESMSLQAGYLYTDSRSKWPDRQRDRGIENNTAFAKVYRLAKLNEHWDYAGSVGMEYQATDTTRDNLWANSFRDMSLKNANTFTYNDNLKLNLGWRQTWFDNKIVLDNQRQKDNLADDSLLSFEMGVSYSPANNWRIRSTAASGYNRFFSKYGNFGTDALNEDGAGDEVVDALNLEFGSRFNWSSGFVDIAVYDIKQDGVPRRNQGKLESMEVKQRGLEAEAFYQVTDSLDLAFSYMHILSLKSYREDGTQVNGNIFWDGQTTPVPVDQFSVRANYQLTADWVLWAVAFYNAGFEFTKADGARQSNHSYNRVDIGAAWNVTSKLTLRARIENLTDEKDFGSTPNDKPVNEEGKIGRVTWLGMDYRF